MALFLKMDKSNKWFKIFLPYLTETCKRRLWIKQICEKKLLSEKSNIANSRHFKFKKKHYSTTHNRILHNNGQCQITIIDNVTFLKIYNVFKQVKTGI